MSTFGSSAEQEVMSGGQKMPGSAQAKFEFDPFSAEVVANSDSYYKELRDKHPVHYSDQYDTYFFSRFSDVWEVLRVGDNTFLATETNLPTAQYLRTHRNNGAPPFASINPMAPGPTLPSPYYEEMRLAHTAPLRPKNVAALKEFVRELARKQLNEILPRRKLDLTADYAAIVPARVICHLFGLPLSVADKVLRDIGEIGRYQPGKQGIDLSTFFSQLQQHIVPAIQARRDAGADGSNGLIDGLINYRTESDARALSNREIADQLVCAMVGGMESVPKVTGRGIMELWRRPDQLKAVRADLEKNVPLAVEEMIRYCAPAQYTFRIAHKDATVAGQHVKAGQRVACLLYAASRDEREFEHPDEFIWNRSIPRVLSFGLGQHHCIGKHLAQLEIRTLVHEFLSRVNSFDFILEEAGLNLGYFQRGWINLPVLIRD
jgi:cytochrome P450